MGRVVLKTGQCRSGPKLGVHHLMHHALKQAWLNSVERVATHNFGLKHRCTCYSIASLSRYNENIPYIIIVLSQVQNQIQIGPSG